MVGLTRREFIKLAGAAGASGGPFQAQGVGQPPFIGSENLEYRSKFFKVQLAPDRLSDVDADQLSRQRNRRDHSPKIGIPHQRKGHQRSKL